MSSSPNPTPNQNAGAGFKVAPQANDPTKPTQHRVIVDAPFQIRPLGNRQAYLKLMVYGKHGAGKTSLAGSAVDCEPMRDVMMIDAESGDLALEDNPRIQHANLISHVPVTSFKQVAFVHQFLHAHCVARQQNDVTKMKALESKVTGVPANEIAEPKRYQTVIVDSLSEIDQYSLYALQGLDQSQLLSDPDSIDVARFEEFRKNNEMVKMLCRAFRDLPMHVIFVCSSTYNQDERKQFHYAPYLTGKLATQVQGMMDIVGYIVAASQPDEHGVQHRRMFIQPGEVGGAKFDAKNRRAIYKPAYFDDPVMDTVMRQTGMLK